VPELLTMRILDGPLVGSYPIVFDSFVYAWQSGTVGTCGAQAVSFQCGPSGWKLIGPANAVDPNTVNCSESLFLFVGLDLSGCGGQTSETILVFGSV
jgi:hypothetical protein